MPPKVTRKCPRYPVDWEVKTCNGHPVTQTFLLDISAIGARIEGPHPLYQQRHVEFTYLTQGDNRQNRQTGKVMWMRPVGHTGRYRWGLSFTKFNLLHAAIGKKLLHRGNLDATGTKEEHLSMASIGG